LNKPFGEPPGHATFIEIAGADDVPSALERYP
jgi:hypothetical protein